MSLNPQKITLEKQQRHANGIFPLVYAAPATGSADTIKDWIEKHADQLADELEIHGAILFRDFGVTDDLGCTDLRERVLLSATSLSDISDLWNMVCIANTTK